MTTATLNHEKAVPQLHRFATSDELSKSLADFVVKAQNAALERRGKFYVALSGGSLPRTLAQGLMSRADDAVQWDKWHVFFADERLVPLSHDDSNCKLAMDELFSKVPMPREQIYTIDESQLDDAEEVADKYEKQLVQAFVGKDTVRNPVFDLILLGMGPDGHTCSLFPGHALLEEQDRWIAPIEDSPKPPARRITFTYSVLNHAHHCAFVLTGDGKQDMLAKVLDHPEDGLPSCLVRPFQPGMVHYFADDAAAKKTQYKSTAWESTFP